MFSRKKCEIPDRFLNIPICEICPSPFESRTEFDEYDLLSLSQSIKHCGILTPIAVRKLSSGRYELIAGERRLRAAGMAGLKTIPCVIHNINDGFSSVFSLVENLQRKNLSMFDEAAAILKIIRNSNLTQTELAQHLGVAQSTLSNKLKLLVLTKEQQEKILSSGLTERHARALSRLPCETRDEVLNIVIARQLTVFETDKLVENVLAPKSTASKPKETFSFGNIRLFSNSLSRIVDTIRKSGLEAKTTKDETDDYIKYTVTILKNKAKSKAAAEAIPFEQLCFSLSTN